MRLTEIAGLLASSISAGCAATRSPAVAAMAAAAVSLLMITENRYASLHKKHCLCVGLGAEKERS